MEKSLRKDANINSGLLLGFSVITFIIGQLAILAIYKIYGITEDNRNTPDGYHAMIVVQIVYNIIKYVIFLPSLILIARKSGQGIGNSLKMSFCKPQVKTGKIVKWIFIGIFITYFTSGMGALLISAIQKAAGVTFTESNSNTDGSAFGGIAIAIMLIFMAPILEEVIFRGVFLRNLEKYGSFLAVIYSAVMFALWHTNYAQIPLTLGAGICFSFLMAKTRSIFPSIILHMCINFFATFRSLFPYDPVNGFGSGFNPSAIYLILFGMIVTGLILLIITLIKSRDDFKLENNCKELTASRKFIGLWLAPLTVITVVYFIGITIHGALR
ncbi:MAG: CPBP family intramembrane metalloprotease [Ruminococcus sp.]|jgi:membrane protease YdiL (CAAX protease family)|nr:CPBP family intramembrane metalloprotease [Ruminococcus sp.]